MLRGVEIFESFYVSMCSVVSNSFQLHGLQPARLLCPWNFQAGIQEWVAISSSRDLPGNEPTSLASPTSRGGFFFLNY